MKQKGLICLLLALLLLTGCGKTAGTPETPAEPPVSEITPAEPEAPAEAEEIPSQETELPAQTDVTGLPLPEEDAVYLYTNDAHSVAVRADGEILLENTDGTLSALTDAQTGELTGFLVQRQEGFRVDDWGNLSPQRAWCDLYDLDGRFLTELPLRYVSAYGDFLYGYSSDSGKSMVYSRSTGQLLYDDVVMFQPIGRNYYLAQGVWGSPGVILSAGGQVVAQMPKEYSIDSVLDSRYLVTMQNGLYGLLDETGQELLPCRYTQIRSASDGYAQVQEDGLYQVIDLSTGETVFRWEHPIELVLPETLVVQIDDNYSGCMLVDYDGTPLMDDSFSWITCAAQADDGTPSLLCGTRNNGAGSQSIYFTPGGELVNTFSTGDGYGQLISETAMLVSTYQWDDSTQTSYGTVQILDLKTGETLYETEGAGINAYPMYTDPMIGDGQEDGYIILSQSNEQGWARYSVIHQSGQVLLEDLQNPQYCGGGVLQCTKGFTSGLMRLDGTWLYRETSFSSLNDQ